LETTQMASQVLEDNLARGVASGDFRPLSPSQVGFVLISLVAGLVLRMRSASSADQWSALMDTIESLIVDGLFSRPNSLASSGHGES